MNGLAEVERDHILRALEASNWVIGGQSGAAARLGMKRTSLVYRMKKLRIRRPDRLQKRNRRPPRPTTHLFPSRCSKPTFQWQWIRRKSVTGRYPSDICQ